MSWKGEDVVLSSRGAAEFTMLNGVAWI